MQNKGQGGNCGATVLHGLPGSQCLPRRPAAEPGGDPEAAVRRRAAARAGPI